jgi:hypothetical protein
LVEVIESLVKQGTLRGHELFLFTDNSTAESAFFKGTSSSEKLFNLVLRLQKIEMEGELFIHLVHVAGTQRIWSGVDGLSRGDRNAGVMAGDCMLSFVPLLSQSVNERSPKLLPWIHSWATLTRSKGKPVIVLLPTRWCDSHLEGVHSQKTWVDSPSHCASAYDCVLEEKTLKNI